MATVDVGDLEGKVQQMYRQVAEQPHASYHFEMGRALAQRLGYPEELLAAIPEGAVESFAGVGYFFDLASLQHGETVIDLGSGSGMDTLIAAGGLRHLERGHQLGTRQARCVRRSSAGTASGRTPGDRRHHHREATH